MGVESAARDFVVPTLNRLRVRPDSLRLATLSWTDRNWAIALIVLAAASFLIRARYFGNPFIDVDEEFYLLIGDRMLHGALPYVDIWDRKPVGLFLLYAGIRALGGDGILVYQIVASAFAAATAAVIALIARRISSPGAALLGGLAYFPALAMNGGAGGQAPVFYNLPMALAALLIVRLTEAQRSSYLLRGGALTMLLVGLALQIKYSAVFEGVYFGVALLWLDRRRNTPAAYRMMHAAIWISIALLPTIAAYLFYLAIGHGHDFVFANFTSIIARGAVPFHHQWADLKHILLRLAPFALVLIVGECLLRDVRRGLSKTKEGAAVNRFVLGWLFAAVAGVAAFGTFFNHYALPLLVPLAVAVTPTSTIRYRAAGATMTSVLLFTLFISYPLDAAKQEHKHGDAAYARILSAEIAPALHGRCLYVFYGEPILYQLVHSCLPTRWAFPFHLSLAREAPALGVDPLREAKRIMAMQPPVVVDRINDDDEVNLPVQALIRADLRRNYRLSFSHPHGTDIDQIWIRQ